MFINIDIYMFLRAQGKKKKKKKKKKNAGHTSNLGPLDNLP